MVCIRFVLLIILLWGLNLNGCAAHYQQVKPDRTELYLKKRDVKDVKIAYSLDQFAPHPVRKISASTWMASIPTTLEFSYFYIIDGAVYLPDCSYTEFDDFGSKNCIFHPK